MSKGLDVLERLVDNKVFISLGRTQGKKQFANDINIIEKELKALNIISQNFKLVGNCLHARNPYAESGWIFVKELEDEEEHNAWKEVLL